MPSNVDETETTPIEQRLAAVQRRIRDAERRFQRQPGSVALLAVSKTKPAGAIAQLARAGQRRFGENYLQEALDKMAELDVAFEAALGLSEALEWHFIGPIQSNKTRLIAEHFAWVHSIDRLKIARRLSAQRPEAMAPLNLCLQVNIDREPSKSGFVLSELPTAAQAIAELPRLRLRGLMAIPAPRDGFDAQRQPFARLAAAQRDLNAALGLGLDTLSMGMSDDIEAAIAEGSTLVRIGTALFGPRRPSPKP